MIDPRDMTAYDLSDNDLEERLIFSICVAGKNAMTTARAVDAFLREAGWQPERIPKDKKGERFHSPFEAIRNYEKYFLPYSTGLEELLFQNGIGCYTMKARSIHELVHADLDLRTCTTEDLEDIHGIGFKTSRFFLLHTRRDVRVAALDTHILKYLKSKGVKVPKTTPGSKKKYTELENKFLEFADASGKPLAEFDLELWNQYAGHSEAISA